MGKVFISYRREDSAGHTGRLQERLSAELGRKNVFVDVESIRPGADFIRAVEGSVKAANLVLVVIGKDWLNAKDEHGTRRLDNPADYVHQEVAMALASKAKVLPVLVQGAKMPSSVDLPKPLQSLSARNAVELRDTRWDDDVNNLIKNFGGISALRRLFRRRSIKILSVLMLFGLLVGGYVFFATEKVAGSVEQFLTLLALDQVDQAYALTSQPFQASVSRQRFAQEVERLGLKDNASATWNSRELGGGKAVLKGSVLTKRRAAIPLTVTLIQEQGAWKILQFEGPAAGIQASGSAPAMPDDAQIRRLASRTLSQLDDAIVRQDFSALHDSAAHALQSQYDAEQLKEAFVSFIQGGVRLGPIDESPLVFTVAPFIDDNGALRLKGYHQDGARRLSFELGYLYESPTWRPIVFDVNVKGGDAESAGR